MVIVLFILLGMASGLLGGLIGIGGGVITVPFLYLIFHYMGMAEENLMRVAIATSLAAAAITSGVATLVQWRKKAIDLRAIRYLAPGLFVGCAIGSWLGYALPNLWLREGFGVIAIGLGLYFCFPRLPHLRLGSEPNRGLSLIGLLIGTLSSLLGIGGGSLVFPIFLGYHLPAKNAAASASLSTWISTLVGTLAYQTLAVYHPLSAEGLFGYIEGLAFIAISAGACFTAPIGVHLSHRLDIAPIKQIFGVSLALVGLSLLLI